jgi:hypothetical protein
MHSEKVAIPHGAERAYSGFNVRSSLPLDEAFGLRSKGSNIITALLLIGRLPENADFAYQIRGQHTALESSAVW